MLNDIVKSETQFYFPLSKIGYVDIPGLDLPLCLEMLHDGDIRKVAGRSATRNFDSIMYLLHGRPNDPSSVIEKFYMMFDRYAGWFSFRYGVTENGLRLVLEHTYGRKWSVFLSEYNTVIWKNMCNNMESKIQDSAVSLDISLNRDAIKTYMRSGLNLR
ncbi:MAG: hypothetical protein KGI27_09335 [Thaumarchaeota archaeon]|nr:hypothetical protein [Nitrososphaerota archaeon]